jgi:hypothetical protein
MFDLNDAPADRVHLIDVPKILFVDQCLFMDNAEAEVQLPALSTTKYSKGKKSISKTNLGRAVDSSRSRGPMVDAKSTID